MRPSVRQFTFYLLAVLIPLLTALPLTASAQTGAQAILFPLQLDKFPELAAYLDVHLENGDFVHDLHPENLEVLENGQARPVDELKELRAGVQFALAFSLGPSLGIRDSQGNSRLDYIKLSLSTWGGDPSQSKLDDLSLVAQDGPEIAHVSTPAELLTTLGTYQPEVRHSTPDLEVLSRALQIIADPVPRPGMERVVLFVTPLQPAEALVGLQSLAAQASYLGTRIFVWLVASPEDAAQPGAAQLQNLALQTNGRFFIFSGIENLPNLEDYLEPLRYIYSLTYASALNASGEFPVSVQVTLNDQVINSPSQNVALQIKPPNPIIVSPPAEIVRSAKQPAEQNKGPTLQSGEIRLLPVQRTINLLVEFPDGYNRTIVRSAFFVDGKLVEEKNAPPFDSFNWDLSAYLESGIHLLRVEVNDSLGLTGSSVEIPIRVTIQSPANTIRSILAQRNLLLAGVIILVSGSILGLVLILTGRLQPVLPGRATPVSRRLPDTSQQKSEAKAARLDPLTQPIAEKKEVSSRRLPRWTLHLPHSHGRGNKQTLAFLTPVSLEEEAVEEAPVPIAINGIVFGRDAALSTWAIDDPSLEPVHAHLVLEGHAYRIFDDDTIAGTWVNYSPVPKTGTLLEHGDLIHIGRVCFRFRLRSAERIAKPILHTPEHSRDSI